MDPNYIIFDLEATCWRGPAPNGRHEIIEIGALRLDYTGHCLGTFSRFVKPILNPLLSPFCRSLTGIQQEDINRAYSFKEVVRDFLEWAQIEDEHSFLISWGENDYHYFKNDCFLHKIEDQWVEKHVDLRKHFKTLKRLHNYVSLKKALVMEGLEFEGDRHRAYDDAYNLSRVFARHIDEWNFY